MTGAKPANARGSLLACALAIAGIVGAAAPAAAQQAVEPTRVYIEATGHTADLLFLDAYRAQPDLIGDPITEEFRARSGFQSTGAEQLIQYFENLALVYVPDAPAGEQIQPLELGRMAVEQQLATRPSPALEQAVRRTACAPGADAACVGFAGTGKTLSGAFLEFWQAEDGARWLGAPLTEAYRAPDRSLVQYFERGALRMAAGQEISALPLGTVFAREQRLRTAPIPQPEGVPVYDEALFSMPAESATTADAATNEDWVQPAVPVGWITGTAGPGPIQGGYKEVVVSISQASLWAYEDGQLMASSIVSTGKGDHPLTVTPLGYHQVLTKYEKQDMQGNIGGDEYFTPDVPWILYFDDLGNALHGAYWHNDFGIARSHGCVNLPLDIAEWIYNWAPIGTPITIIE